jgi:hypothetical protein
MTIAPCDKLFRSALKRTAILGGPVFKPLVDFGFVPNANVGAEKPTFWKARGLDEAGDSRPATGDISRF